MSPRKSIYQERREDNERSRKEREALYPKEARGRTFKVTNETYTEFLKFIGQMQAETGEHVTANTALHELLMRCGIKRD